MKKIISAYLLTVFISLNPCFAFSELYYFKNIKTSEVEPLVKNSFDLYGYAIKKENPYYAVNELGNDYAIVILQQSGDNMFYYYQADKGNKPNKSLLKAIKRKNIIYEQSFNTGIIGVYDEIAQSLKANDGSPIQYSFSEESEVISRQQARNSYDNQRLYSGYVAQVSAGTKFNVYLQNAINTATASEGDTVTAVVQDGLMYKNDVIIPQGSLVYGTLTKARNATYASINGRVVIKFNKVVTPENQVYDITAETIDFTVSNEGKVGKSVKSAATTAVVGAALGLLFGLLSDNGHAGRSAAIGAGIGAGSSLVYSAAEKGVDAEIPSFTELELTLTSPLSVNISR